MPVASTSSTQLTMANQKHSTGKRILLYLFPLLLPPPEHLLWTDALQSQRSVKMSFRQIVDVTTTTRTKRPLYYGHYWKRTNQVQHHQYHLQRRHTMILRDSVGEDKVTIDETSRIYIEQQGQNTNVKNNTKNVNLPKHIAFVCDGNTRWAKQHQQPTLMGHFMGANRTVELIQTLRQQSSSSSSLSSSSIHHHDITHLTFFAFSTENWNRPMSEIRNLFNILEQTAHYWYNTLQHEEQEQQRHQKNWNNQFSNSNTYCNHRNMIIKFIGDLNDPRIPNSLRIILYKLQESTLSRGSSTTDVSIEPLTICIAINYGGRQDIVRASQRLMIKLLQEKNNATSATAAATATISEMDIRQHITEANLQSCFDTHDIPDPDLFIRTSGEVRLSNFLLWNVAYTELYFTNIYWPDFTMAELDNALVWYSQRKRRFGGNVERVEK